MPQHHKLQGQLMFLWLSVIKYYLILKRKLQEKWPAYLPVIIKAHTTRKENKNRQRLRLAAWKERDWKSLKYFGIKLLLKL